MKKPEKKEAEYWFDDYQHGQVEGYNESCDDYNKFLHSEEEILKILLKESKNFNVDKESKKGTSLPTKLASTIHKRLRGES